jgi:hypothetical protein
MAKHLKSAREVVDALGGPTAISRMIEGIGTTAPWNWYERGLPPETYVVLTAELLKRGLIASPSLWKMREAAHVIGGEIRWDAESNST